VTIFDFHFLQTVVSGSKCAYGGKIYASFFVLQKCGAGDVSQQQFTFCLCCTLSIWAKQISLVFSVNSNPNITRICYVAYTNGF
jgi:hypothetical protein